MLNNVQIIALNADMLARPELAAAMAGGDDVFLANFYNVIQAETAWVTLFDRTALYDVIDWQEIIARSQAERDTLALMFMPGQVDTSRPNIRKGFADIFSGSNQRSRDQRSALIAAAQRPMILIELLFASGPVAGIYSMVVEGDLSIRDASKARAL